MSFPPLSLAPSNLVLATLVRYCASRSKLEALSEQLDVRHQFRTPLAGEAESTKMVITTIIGASFYGFVAIFLKCLRIFCTRRRNAALRTSHILLCFNFLLYTICAFIEIFPCNSVQNYRKPWLQGGRCLDVKALNVAAASFHTASDIFILIVPQKAIWKLQLSLKKNLGDSTIFSQ